MANASLATVAAAVSKRTEAACCQLEGDMPSYGGRLHQKAGCILIHVCLMFLVLPGKPVNYYYYQVVFPVSFSVVLLCCCAESSCVGTAHLWRW